MEHEQAQELLSEYLEGCLPKDRRHQVDEHLQTCDECQGSLAMLNQSMQAIKGLPQVEAPPNFARRVRRRARRAGLISGRHPGRSSRIAGPFQSNLTTVMLLVAVGALILFVLVVQKQIELLTLPPPPIRIQVEQAHSLQPIAALTWKLNGQVQVGDRLLPKGSPMAGHHGMELAIQPADWGDFIQGLGSIQPDIEVPNRPPSPGGDGFLHLSIRIAPGETNEGSHGEGSGPSPPGDRLESGQDTPHKGPADTPAEGQPQGTSR